MMQLTEIVRRRRGRLRCHVTAGALMVSGTMLAGGGPVRAQTVTGTWRATWAQAVTVSADGTVSIRKWGSATLDLTQQGDSVTGTWTTQVVQTVQWKVSGTFHDGRLVLRATQNDATDPEIAAISAIQWRGTVRGDSMSGQMTLEFKRTARPSPERPWKATRANED